MKSGLVVAAIAILALSGPAIAADLAPAYKASQLVSPVWSWTGFNIGANAGAGIARNATKQTVIEDPPLLTPLETFTSTPAGFVGGGQVGYNYQFAPNWL